MFIVYHDCIRMFREAVSNCPIGRERSMVDLQEQFSWAGVREFFFLLLLSLLLGQVSSNDEFPCDYQREPGIREQKCFSPRGGGSSPEISALGLTQSKG